MAETRTVHALGSEHRGRRLAQWLALMGAAVAVAVIVTLVVSWPSGGGASVSETAPAAQPPRSATAVPKPVPAPVAPAGKPDVLSNVCDPIFGGAVPHRVTSSATRGAPTGCGHAHSILLAALKAGSASVGDWRCVSRPNERTLEACTSAGRRIAARN
ncbi:MAG TPA: hypothetical protein VLB79_08945 [Solirubrobacterales bacterium]|nr:hypothetical protein [Solirubrobacterales bacterium]